MSAAARKAWIVAASIGAVEALKDQGFCRWNYALRLIQQHANTKMKAYNSQAHRLSALRSSSAVSKRVMPPKETTSQTEESMKKVMQMNCWGPSTVRF